MRRWSRLFGLVMALLLLSGCTALQSPAAGKTPLTVDQLVGMKPSSASDRKQYMNWYPQPAHGGFHAAVISGHYAKRNINIIETGGGPGISVAQLVATGQVDFGMVGPDSVFLGYDKPNVDERLPLVAVFATFQTDPQCLMYHGAHPASDFSQLGNRKVIVGVNSGFWDYIEGKYKLTGVERVNFNGQLAVWQADPKSVTQCYSSSEPLSAKRQGIQAGHLLVADSGFNRYQNVMVVTRKMIDEKPELVQAYVTSALEGWVSFLKDPTQTFAHIATTANPEKYREKADWLPEEAAIERPLILGSNDPNDFSRLGTMTRERMTTLHQQMREIGQLKNDVDIDATFDTRFVTAARKELGLDK